MALVTDWQAAKVSGERISRRELRAGDLLAQPFKDVQRAGIETDHKGVPFVRVAIDPLKGDRMGVPYSKRSVEVSTGRTASIPVVEIMPGPGRIVRLELHEDGPVLITADRLEF